MEREYDIQISQYVDSSNWNETELFVDTIGKREPFPCQLNEIGKEREREREK